MSLPHISGHGEPSKHIYMYTCINIASYQYPLNMFMYLTCVGKIGLMGLLFRI